MAIPKIRLKGYNGDWKRFPFHFVAKPYFVSNKLVHHQNLLSLSYGKIKRKDINSDKGLLPASFDTYQIIKNGIIVFRFTDLQNDKKSLRVGLAKEEGIISPAYVCVECENISPEFLFLQLYSYDLRKVFYSMGDGLRQTLSYNEVKSMPIYVPSEKEQKAIVDYFNSIEANIQSEESKLVSLKQMKSASLVSMFPQAGETTPRVRFKGFKGGWDKKLLSELYEPSSIKNRIYGADKIISVANMYFKPVSYISDDEYLKSYNVMSLGDIAFEGNKSKDFAHGRFVENTIGDGIVSHVFVVLKPISKKYDLQFWKYYINYERIMGPILQRCTKHSTMMTDIVVADFLKESILVPSYEEQKKIGTFFEILDKQISMQEKRLEKLKQIKAACLDKMFV